MPHLESLGFEAFPAEVRLKIYRELLVDERGQKLDPPEMRDNPGSGLHPQILACNKKIHDEAAAVLYGENRFTFEFAGYCPSKLWHYIGSDKTILPRRYSRLITSMRIAVGFKGNDNDISGQAVMEGFDQTLANMEDVCKKLSLNDLKWLGVYYINSYTGGPVQAAIMGGGRFPGRPYTGENCLLPLMKVRATRFTINNHASPAFIARLKAKVQGPKDAVFLAGRQRQMEEPESDFEVFEEDEEDEEDE